MANKAPSAVQALTWYLSAEICKRGSGFSMVDKRGSQHKEWQNHDHVVYAVILPPARELDKPQAAASLIASSLFC
jgi:hypothetical protein